MLVYCGVSFKNSCWEFVVKDFMLDLKWVDVYINNLISDFSESMWGLRYDK